MKTIPRHELVMKIKNGTLTEEDIEGFEDAITENAVERALRAMPQVVDHLTKQAFLLRKLSTEFYEKHPDLAKHRELVVKTIEETEAKNPHLGYQELLEKVAPMARQKLGVTDSASLAPAPLDLNKLDSNLGDL